MPQSKKKNRKQTKLPTNQLSFEKITTSLLLLLVLLLPTQLGKHWFFDFSYLSGVRIDYLAPTLYVTDCIAILLIVFNIKTVVYSVTNKWWLLIAVLTVINIIFAASPAMAGYKFFKYAEFIGLFFVAKNAVQKIPSFFALGAFIIGASYEFILSLLQFLYQHSLQGIFYWLGERSFSLSTPDIAKVSWQGVELLRPYGTFSHPNSLAGFYLLVYCFALLYKPFNRYTIWKYGFLLICALLIFLSFSKYIIALFVVLNVVYTIMHRKEINCLFCIVSRILIFSVLGAVFFFAHGDVFSLQKRGELVGNSLQIIGNHPLLGVGLGNYLYAQHEFVIRYPYFFLQPVHNIFLLFIAETGIVLSAVVGWKGWQWIKRQLPNEVFIYCLAIVIITGLFDHYWLTLQQNFLLLPILFAITTNPGSLIKSSRKI